MRGRLSEIYTIAPAGLINLDRHSSGKLFCGEKRLNQHLEGAGHHRDDPKTNRHRELHASLSVQSLKREKYYAGR
jgi:hypothetical protein